jgi:integrase
MVSAVMTKHTYPVQLNHKGSTATIYRTPIRGEAAFTITFYECAKRRRKVVMDEATAHAEADKIVKRLVGGELKLNADEGRIYNAALEAVGAFGVSLVDACIEWAQARKLSGNRLLEAATAYGQRNDTVIEGKPLADAVKEFLEGKKHDVGAHYHREYTCKLNQLAGAFVGYNISSIEPARVDDYLRGLAVSKRTRKNARTVLLKFFNWAKTRRYVSKAFNYEEGVATVKAPNGKIEIYTPDELRGLLSHAHDALVPFLAIAAFAGLRHAEIGRLDWSAFDWKAKHITLPEEITKNRQRRLVPIASCLKDWLSPYVKESGRVCSRENMSNALWRLGVKAGIKWRHNALRHSYISYRVAKTKNVDATALECGNSAQMIFTNYRELVKPKAAQQWFAITPGAAAQNLVTMKRAA